MSVCQKLYISFIDLDPRFIYSWSISQLQGSKKKNQFEYFLFTFEHGFYKFSFAKFCFNFLKIIVASAYSGSEYYNYNTG